jgi:predicted nucleic acid-binding protein
LEGSTISLAYYEAGNAIWRECFLLERIIAKEASQLLRTIFKIIQMMNVVTLEDEDHGNAILEMAGKLNITYYDAAYLTETQKSEKTLVTDDEELAKAAQSLGLETLTSKAIRQQHRP